jgi:hypothetical protein
MTDEFNLEIGYKGELKEFPAQLLLQGHTHKFKVLLDGSEIFFEPDEEGSWQKEKIDKNLLKAIQEKIEAILF